MSADKKIVGARLRAERKAHGLVVAELASRFRSLSPSLPKPRDLERTIRGHEAGEHAVSERYRFLYCQVYDKTEEQLFAAQEQPRRNELGDTGADASLVDLLSLAWTVGRLDHAMDRRTVLQLAATFVATPALGIADPIERIASALSGPTGLSDDLVHHLEDRTVGFHRLEFVLPATQIFRGLLAHLSELTSLLEVTPQSPGRNRLARTAGESAVLGAWLAWDLGDVSRAAGLYRVAELAAREGDDPAILACSAIYKSFAISATGSHTIARRVLAEARGFLPEHGDRATRAWLIGREAEEAAALDDPAAWDLINEASDLLGNARPHSERSWTRCLESPRLPHMRLTIGTRLRNEDVVYDEVSELAVLASDPAQKKTGRMLASIGLALVEIGDLDEGVRFGERSVEAVKVGKATYALNRLGELEAALQDRPGPRVGGLREDIRATRLALASPHPSIPGTPPALH